MTLATSGTLSMSNINTEIGKYGTYANFWLSHADARQLAGVPSGTISFSNFRGKSWYIPVSAGGNNAFAGNYNSTSSGGTASAYPSVSPSGGTGSYTYSWSAPNGTGIASLSNTTSQTCTVSKSFLKGQSGSFTVTLQCVVSDGTSSVTVSNITADASWGTLA